MHEVYIIAEAGVNHNGDITIAKKMVDYAVQAGADAIKFQTFKAENLACRDAKKAEYQLQTTNQGESQFDMLKRLELSYEMHIQLIEYCQNKGIQFLSTPFDIDSIHLLARFDLPCLKIPSGEITNLPYLREMGKLNKKIILSTGMSSMEEIRDALTILRNAGTQDISVLHCNTQYPTPYEDVNLKVIPRMKSELEIPVGYSDHTEGIEVSLAAVALGATIIEKHFTLERNMEGPDHKASIEPNELEMLVNAIRNIECALGSDIKEATSSERDNIQIVRKSIVAKHDIKQGEMFSEENLTVKRPGNGISPMKWDELLGQAAPRSFKEDELIIL